MNKYLGEFREAVRDRVFAHVKGEKFCSVDFRPTAARFEMSVSAVCRAFAQMRDAGEIVPVEHNRLKGRHHVQWYVKGRRKVLNRVNVKRAPVVHVRLPAGQWSI